MTGVDDDALAQYALNKYNWDVQLAVQEYLAGGVEMPSMYPSSSPVSRPVPPASAGRGGATPLHRRSISPGSERRGPRNNNNNSSSNASGGSNSLDDSADDDGRHDDDDDDGRAPLLGGGAGAGANRQPAAAGQVNRPAAATVTSTSIIALPFKVINVY